MLHVPAPCPKCGSEEVYFRSGPFKRIRIECFSCGHKTGFYGSQEVALETWEREGLPAEALEVEEGGPDTSALDDLDDLDRILNSQT